MYVDTTFVSLAYYFILAKIIKYRFTLSQEQGYSPEIIFSGHDYTEESFPGRIGSFP
jgi:hypothetical protein